jgi:hypothetical protein
MGNVREATRLPFDARACRRYNRWKYGLEMPPPYVEGNVGELEARFMTRDVTYLLGVLDTDPNHPALDKSCSGEAQGPYRLARGEAYVRYLGLRHPGGTAQSLAEVAGVGHDGRGMFTSACGLAYSSAPRAPHAFTPPRFPPRRTERTVRRTSMRSRPLAQPREVLGQ